MSGLMIAVLPFKPQNATAPESNRADLSRFFQCANQGTSRRRGISRITAGSGIDYKLYLYKAIQLLGFNSATTTPHLFERTIKTELACNLLNCLPFHRRTSDTMPD